MGGRVAELSIADIFRKEVDVLGSRAATREEQARVLELVAAGKVAPVISARFPLDQASGAHALIDAGEHVGKIVLLP
jgi:NADPH:quinone reductase-like Zn-dependent oxidoreductase